MIQLDNTIVWLLLVSLTTSKPCHVLADIGKLFFRAHLRGGVDCFGASALLLVVLVWIFVVPISQLENAIAWLALVRSTLSKA